MLRDHICKDVTLFFFSFFRCEREKKNKSTSGSPFDMQVITKLTNPPSDKIGQQKLSELYSLHSKQHQSSLFIIAC